jgi:hypothetical protein
MITKRINCIFLTLVMVLCLTACGSSSAPKGDGSTNTSDVDINTLADAERANFPVPSEAYDTVLSNVQMDTQTFDVYLGKMIAAYENLSAEEFCKYIYELNEAYDDYINNISSLLASTSQLLSLAQTEEAAEKCAALNTFNLTLTEYHGAWKAWNVEYLRIAAKAESAPTHQQLKTQAKDLINTFSSLLYGKNMVH